MPFVAPLLAAPIIASLGLAAGGIGAALVTGAISAGLSLGLGVLARKIGPKQSAQSGAGARLSLKLDPNASREVVLGRAALAGSLVYHHVYGPNGNDYLQLVFALADHECDGLDAIYVDGKAVTLGASVTTDQVSGQTVDEYPNAMWVSFHSGTWDQTADADLVAKSGGRWTADDRGRGVAYVRVTMLFDQMLYKGGAPRFLFVVRGAKLYDWRLDTTAGGSGSQRWGQPATYAWTANPVVHLYNWRRGIFAGTSRLAGLNTPAAMLPLDWMTAEANACDEPVSLKAGGTEPRYRSHGVVPVSSSHRDVVADLVAACAGVEVESGGLVRPITGISRAAVLAIADGDMLAEETVEITPRKPRSSLINAVFGSFVDPAQQYETIALPPRIAPDDEAEDGDIQLHESYALDHVTSGTQGQRVLEIFRRRERHQIMVSMSLRSRFCVLEPGDWVEWTSDRYGFVGQTFEVSSVTLRPDLTVRVEMRQTAAGIYAWSPGTDELDPSAPQPVGSGGERFTQLSGWDVVAVEIAGGGGASRPGIRATWTAVTDASVNEILIEYRRVGDTVALERRVADPAAGQYTWLDGVQGGISYEARSRPVTTPERGTAWSSWVSTASNTAPQIVAVAAMALGIDPELIPDAELDAQSRFELRLATALDTTQGSVNERLALVYAEIARINKVVTESLVWQDEAETFARREELTRVTDDEALARITDELAAVIDDPMTGIAAQAAAREVLEGRVDTAEGNIASTSSAVTALQSTVNHPSTGLATRASSSVVSALSSTVSSQGNAITANASAITALETEVDGNTNSITQILQVEGGKKRFAIIFDSNGKFTGGISLDGTETITSLDIAVSELNVYDPSVSGGAPLPLLQVATVGGVPQMILNGTFITRAIEAGVINANSGSIGTLTAGLIRNPANTAVFEAENMRWRRLDGKADVDLLNRRIYMESG